MGTLHRRNGFYTVQTIFSIALHLNLPLTGNFVHFYFLKKKTNSVWFISLLKYGDMGNVLMNHLLLVMPLSYPCHYTNLCPHSSQKRTHTHNIYIYIYIHNLSKNIWICCSRNISQYQYWKQSCRLIFLWKPWHFYNSLMNRKYKTTAIICNIILCSIINNSFDTQCVLVE